MERKVKGLRHNSSKGTSPRSSPRTQPYTTPKSASPPPPMSRVLEVKYFCNRKPRTNVTLNPDTFTERSPMGVLPGSRLEEGGQVTSIETSNKRERTSYDCETHPSLSTRDGKNDRTSRTRIKVVPTSRTLLMTFPTGLYVNMVRVRPFRRQHRYCHLNLSSSTGKV